MAGTDLTTQECLFTAAPIHPDETKHQWRVHIGFFEADWETGSSDEFWVQGYIPEIAFDEFLAAFKSGEANGLNLLCKANLWAASWVRYAPIVDQIPWKLSQGERGASMAEGVIEAFSWEVIPKNQPPSKKEEAPAFKAGQKFAEDLFNSLPDTPPAAAAPHQKSRWAWWVAGGIVVLGYLLFKNN